MNYNTQNRKKTKYCFVLNVKFEFFSLNRPKKFIYIQHNHSINLLLLMIVVKSLILLT